MKYLVSYRDSPRFASDWFVWLLLALANFCYLLRFARMEMRMLTWAQLRNTPNEETTFAQLRSWGKVTRARDLLLLVRRRSRSRRPSGETLRLPRLKDNEDSGVLLVFYREDGEQRRIVIRTPEDLRDIAPIHTLPF